MPVLLWVCSRVQSQPGTFSKRFGERAGFMPCTYWIVLAVALVARLAFAIAVKVDDTVSVSEDMKVNVSKVVNVVVPVVVPNQRQFVSRSLAIPEPVSAVSIRCPLTGCHLSVSRLNGQDGRALSQC